MILYYLKTKYIAGRLQMAPKVNNNKLRLVKEIPYKTLSTGGRTVIHICQSLKVKAGEFYYQYVDDQGIIILVPKKLHQLS